MKGITPCLWFDNNAEEAANFYASIFKGSKIGAIARHGKAGPGPEGSVLTVMFEIGGLELMGLNGGPVFEFNEAVSFVVNCEGQKEVDYYWEKLSRGGEKSVCGWLKDKYGVSWQVVPIEMRKLMSDPDPVKVERVTRAMLQMKKLDIAKLKKAYKG